MTYDEAEETLQKWKLDIESFANAVGLKKRSIRTNYKNNPKGLPKYYTKLLDLYIKFENEKAKNSLLEEKASLNNLINNNIILDEKAKKIVNKKCLENNITISEYLSSLVISNI